MDNIDLDRSNFHADIALQKRIVRTASLALQSTSLPEVHREQSFPHCDRSIAWLYRRTLIQIFSSTIPSLHTADRRSFYSLLDDRLHHIVHVLRWVCDF